VNALAIWPDRRLVLSDVRTGESSHGNTIMHCTFGVNLLHTSNNDAHVITSILGLASRSQFFMLVRGPCNESRCLLIEFTAQGFGSSYRCVLRWKLPSRGMLWCSF
jgi:hypothetical protein